MSAIERPSSAGSGSLNPGVSVFCGVGHSRVLSVGCHRKLHQGARRGADPTMLISGSGAQPRGAEGGFKAPPGRNPAHLACVGASRPWR